MTESPSGQGAPEHDSEAALLTETSDVAGPPAPPVPSIPSVPSQPTRDDVETDEAVDTADTADTADPDATVLTDVKDTENDSDDDADGTSIADASDEAPKNPLSRLADRVITEILYPGPGLLLSLLYVGAAVFLTWKLLAHSKATFLAGNPLDQLYFEWQLTTVEHSLLHFQNPLFSHAMNAPYGMNLVGNPQIIGPAAVLTPVTALVGAPVSFALLTTFKLDASASAWRGLLQG